MGINYSAPNYRFSHRVVAEAAAMQRHGRPLREILKCFFRNRLEQNDALLHALLVVNGSDWLCPTIARLLNYSDDDIRTELDAHLRQLDLDALILTGADAVAFMINMIGVQRVFAYPGTSELFLCERIQRLCTISLINGRGDKESAFMAAGACLINPMTGIAILHGARGLTNAAGAVADVSRNEIATLFVVGLPSTSSISYIPPHGEVGLLHNIGSFAKQWHEVGPFGASEPEREHAAASFINSFRDAIAAAVERPFGPVLFGIPQDIAEASWITWHALSSWSAIVTRSTGPTEELVAAAANIIKSSKNIVVLLDDYLLRYPNVQAEVERLRYLCGCQVLQVRYRRGAMLFEKLQSANDSEAIDWLDPGSNQHRELLRTADLLITLEDRNMYERVVGKLPSCQKIAINSNASKVAKNEYMTGDDLMLEGDATRILGRVNEILAQGTAPSRIVGASPAWSRPASHPHAPIPVRNSGSLRFEIVEALANALQVTANPAIVDDSQMFGGLVSEYYDLLPAGTRIFGDHGGFVGSGIAFSTGLAIGNPDLNVFCFLGDQGFTNGIQGLVAAIQEQARVIFVVCNNGGSVSLIKQILLSSDYLSDGDPVQFLRNTGGLDYAKIASGLNIRSFQLDFSTELDELTKKDALKDLRICLKAALAGSGPTLIELRLPGHSEFWAGIWQVRGFDEASVTIQADPE